MNNKFIKIIIMTMCLWGSNVNATEFTGDTLVAFQYSQLFPFGTISGDINLENLTISVNEFRLGGAATVLSAELLPEGTYFRTHYITGDATIVVEPGQIGGYFNVDTDAFGPAAIAVVWDVLALNDGYVLEPVDSDGDGIPGIAYQGDYFRDSTATLRLFVASSAPGIEVVINLNGGQIQECSITGGHNVSTNVTIKLLNDAVFESVEWKVDDQIVGNLQALNAYITLGQHTVSVVAKTTTGQQASASTLVTIRDTTPPVITASFTDNRTGEVISVIEAKNSSFVTANTKATDICDAAPLVTAFGGFGLNDGDTLKIQGNLDKVELTTSVVQMLVKASDASNNVNEEVIELLITP